MAQEYCALRRAEAFVTSARGEGTGTGQSVSAGAGPALTRVRLAAAAGDLVIESIFSVRPLFGVSGARDPVLIALPDVPAADEAPLLLVPADGPVFDFAGDLDPAVGHRTKLVLLAARQDELRVPA